MNLFDVLGKKWSIKTNISGLFSTPPAPPVVASTPDTPAIDQMNADLQAQLRNH